MVAEQVAQTLQSDAALQVLHDLVAERQGGDTSFTFIVPGPPGAFVCHTTYPNSNPPGAFVCQTKACLSEARQKRACLRRCAGVGTYLSLLLPYPCLPLPLFEAVRRSRRCA